MIEKLESILSFNHLRESDDVSFIYDISSYVSFIRLKNCTTHTKKFSRNFNQQQIQQ